MSGTTPSTTASAGRTTGRIATTFMALERDGRKALIPYVTAGFPAPT